MAIILWPFYLIAWLIDQIASSREADEEEMVKKEMTMLKAQTQAAEVARRNNAVALQDLQIEIKKLEILKMERALGMNYSPDDFAPPS